MRIALLDPNDFEADIRLSATDAAVFAFAILEAAGVEVVMSEMPTDEQCITAETYAATLSVYSVSIPDNNNS